jgi:hypothetical protein
MGKIVWTSGCGNHATSLPSKRYTGGYRITVRGLGTGARPYRFRTYVNSGALMLPNQGFSKTLREAKSMGVEWAMAKESETFNNATAY